VTRSRQHLTSSILRSGQRLPGSRHRDGNPGAPAAGCLVRRGSPPRWQQLGFPEVQTRSSHAANLWVADKVKEPRKGWQTRESPANLFADNTLESSGQSASARCPPSSGEDGFRTAAEREIPLGRSIPGGSLSPSALLPATRTLAGSKTLKCGVFGLNHKRVRTFERTHCSAGGNRP
jgi:hypothetical protein